MLDSLLVAGLIEPRSLECMGLLAARSADGELAALYGDLPASEASHFGIYWVPAKPCGDPDRAAPKPQPTDSFDAISISIPACALHYRQAHPPMMEIRRRADHVHVMTS